VSTSSTVTGPTFPVTTTVTATFAASVQVSSAMLLSDLSTANVFVGVSALTPAPTSLQLPAAGGGRLGFYNTSQSNTTWVEFDPTSALDANVGLSPVNRSIRLNYTAPSASTLTFTYTVYVPLRSAAGAYLLDPVAPVAATYTHPVTLHAVLRLVAANSTSFAATSTASRSVTYRAQSLFSDQIIIANSPGSDPGLTVGDVVRVRHTLQLSDYFVVGALSARVRAGDGWRLLVTAGAIDSVVATLSVGAANCAVSNYSFVQDLSQVGNDLNPATDGSTTVLMDLSSTCG
jgi:hypothetical protein